MSRLHAFTTLVLLNFATYFRARNLKFNIISRTFQFHGEETTGVGHDWEYLLLYRRRLQLDTIEDVATEDVHASVDLVRHVFLGLLHEAVDSPRVGAVYDNAVLGGLLYLGYLQIMVRRV